MLLHSWALSEFNSHQENLGKIKDKTMTESNSGLGYTVVNMTVRMIIIAVNLVGNSFILAVLRKSQNFSCVTRHLIGHVAIADIVFGCSGAVHASVILGEAMSYEACLGITTVAIISGLCSCWGICLVFLDNYLSVKGEVLQNQASVCQKHDGVLCVAGCSQQSTVLYSSY